MKYFAFLICLAATGTYGKVLERVVTDDWNTFHQPDCADPVYPSTLDFGTSIIEAGLGGCAGADNSYWCAGRPNEYVSISLRPWWAACCTWNGNACVAICPDWDERFIEVDGICHYIDIDVKTIDEAYSACSEWSGKLWEPQSLDTMNAVHARLESLGTDSNVGIWVGITDENSEGDWYYKSTSESFPFQNYQAPWNSNEPDNRGVGEACAKMSSGSPMEMYDISCTDGRTQYTICELDG